MFLTNSHNYILLRFMVYSVLLFLASTKVNAIEMLGKKCINEERKKREALKFNLGISIH